MAASCSDWGAEAALLRPPTERVLQLPDADVRIAVCERLGIDVAGHGTSRALVGIAATRFAVGPMRIVAVVPRVSALLSGTIL